MGTNDEYFHSLCAKYPPRPLQSETHTGPITLSQYVRVKNVRERLEKEGISLPMPTGAQGAGGAPALAPRQVAP